LGLKGLAVVVVVVGPELDATNLSTLTCICNLKHV
jgi:hypothetical protein